MCLITQLLLTTCISPFTPQGFEGKGGTIVIEGDIILQGETRVYVSLSGVLDRDFSVNYIMDAQVFVLNNDGEKFMGVIRTNEYPPFYTINTRALRFDKEYKLCVYLSDGTQYESDFIAPLITPEMETIEFEVNDSQTAVDFLVTTYGEDPLQNSSRYYKWRYTEDWEFTSFYRTNYYFDPIIGSVVPYNSDPLFYYCWKKDVSTSILVAKTDHLEQNNVIQQKVNTIDYKDDRISYLYSMELAQMSISKEAYLYWSTLRKNTEEIGGIFAPQPSEMFGNIHCVSDPAYKAYGYISAGIVSYKRIIVSKEEMDIYVPTPCPFFDPTTFLSPIGAPLTDKDKHDFGLLVVKYSSDDPVEWASPNCVDCRKKGTKEKPAYWPNSDL